MCEVLGTNEALKLSDVGFVIQLVYYAVNLNEPSGLLRSWSEKKYETIPVAEAASADGQKSEGWVQIPSQPSLKHV